MSQTEERRRQLCKEIIHYAAISDQDGLDRAKLKLAELNVDDCRTCLFYASKFTVGFKEYGPVCRTCKDWSNYRRQPRLSDYEKSNTRG